MNRTAEIPTLSLRRDYRDKPLPSAQIVSQAEFPVRADVLQLPQISFDQA